MYHGDDVDVIVLDTIEDTVWTVQYLAHFFAPILRYFASAVWELTDLHGAPYQALDHGERNEWRVFGDVVMDKL